MMGMDGGERGGSGEEIEPRCGRLGNTIVLETTEYSADGTPLRTEPHGPNHELAGLPIHGVGGVVGRRQGHIARYVPRQSPNPGAGVGCRMLKRREADTWIGMAFVLGGIALCVQSKNT